MEPASHAAEIANFFWDRAGRKKNGQAAGIMEFLRQIARFQADLPAADMKRIADRAKRAAPDRQTTMTPKNARRLRGLAEPTNRAVLLHLPMQLMKEARKPSPEHRKRLASR